MILQKRNTSFPILTFLWAPVLMLLLNYAFFGDHYTTDGSLFLGATAITLPVVWLLSQVQIGLSLHLREKYPRFDQRKARFASWLFLSLPLTLLVIVLLWICYLILPFFSVKVLALSLPWALLAGAVAHILAIIANEGQFTYHQWKNAVIESERLQKINWESRYEGLKQQVNPHFLFNSINTLSSLITEDKTAAGQYVKEMSQVYRYLLRSNDDELVPLQPELRFIHSYYHLLKTRFGEGINLEVSVAPRFHHYLLPPLTLQMLVENAVKHNNISKASPLTITIACTEDGWLMIKNNLQKKQGHIDSTGIGLNNIREKYRLLGLPDVQLLSDEKHFKVMVPLIAQHKELLAQL
jgi:sensor histidine kinase YesM